MILGDSQSEAHHTLEASHGLCIFGAPPNTTRPGACNFLRAGWGGRPLQAKKNKGKVQTQSVP